MKHFLISFWICVILTILSPSSSQIQPYAQRYCGLRFSNTLFALCSQNITKKIPMDYRDNYPDYSLADNNDLEPFLSLLRPKRMLQLRFPFELRKRQKAADECCHKPCTLNQLLEYCTSYMVQPKIYR